VSQVKRFGTEVLAPAQAVSLSGEGEYRVVKLSNGKELVGHCVVIAAGVQWRRLNIPGMDRLTGAGVYYGATMTEAASVKGKISTSWVAQIRLASRCSFLDYARSVNMLVRADSLSKSMSHYLRERVATIPNIKVVPNTEVIEVQGDGRLSGITFAIMTPNHGKSSRWRSLHLYWG